MTTPLIERLMARTHDDAGCAVWDGAMSGQHPYARIGGKVAPVRRAIYEETFGPLRPNQVVHMTCGTPGCICVDHMERTTRKRLMKQLGELGIMSGTIRSANIARAKRKTAKLTPEAVRDIKARATPTTTLAERYNVSKQTIHQVQTNKLWRDISSPWCGLMTP